MSPLAIEGHTDCGGDIFYIGHLGITIKWMLPYDSSFDVKCSCLVRP